MNQGIRDQGSAFADYDRLAAGDSELTAKIQPQLAELGVASEAELCQAGRGRGSRTASCAEAKRVALDMLDENEDEANARAGAVLGSRSARPTSTGCWPPTRRSASSPVGAHLLDPGPRRRRCRSTRRSAGVTHTGGVREAHPRERAVRDGRHRPTWTEHRTLLRTAAAALQRGALLLRPPLSGPALPSEYVPGSFSQADPMELGKLVGRAGQRDPREHRPGPRAINDDDLKVWNMRDVLRITQERLGVSRLLLAAIDATDARRSRATRRPGLGQGGAGDHHVRSWRGCCSRRRRARPSPRRGAPARCTAASETTSTSRPPKHRPRPAWPTCPSTSPPGWVLLDAAFCSSTWRPSPRRCARRRGRSRANADARGAGRVPTGGRRASSARKRRAS